MHRLLSVMACFVMLAGCTSHRAPDPDPPTPPAAPSDYPVSSPWTDFPGNLQMQLRVDRTITEETGVIRAIAVIRNNSAATVELRAPGSRQPMLHWRADALPVGEAAIAEGISLAPGAQWVSPPAVVSMPPGAPRRELKASVVCASRTLSAMIPITLTPAEWGTATNGLRLRLSSDKQDYAVGERPAIRLFLTNATDHPMNVHPLDPGSVKLSSTRERLLFSFQTDDEHVVALAPGGTLSLMLPDPPLLAPGDYRMLVWISSTELSASHPIAWFGQLESNEIGIEVR